MLDLLTVFFFQRFRARPGHFFGSIGLVLGFVGSAAMSWLAVVKFVLHEDIGTRPLFLIAVLLLVFSIQFLTTGLLAEMMSRIFYQQEHGPLTISDGAASQHRDGWREIASTSSPPAVSADDIAARG